MWFKHIQIFQLTAPISSSAESLSEKLEPLAFKSCLPSMMLSSGWISPLDEDDPIYARGLNGCLMICLKIEEKILPASVINQSLKERMKEIEVNEGRKMRQKEKLSFKDEITFTLLPRAFSKFSTVAAYIDTRNQWLIVNAISPAKTNLFISMLKKSLGDVIEPFDILKVPSILTHWVKTQDYPNLFSVERACVLQDPQQQNRMIRATQQDLFSSSIQSLIKDGCEVIQVALCWQDRINFVINQDFIIRGLNYTDDDIAEIKDELESKLQKFDADFVMMIEIFTGLLNDLLNIFLKTDQNKRMVVNA